MSPPEDWSLDTEWGFCDGHVDWESAWEPVVLCLVGRRSGRRLHFWGRDPQLRHFFRDHAEDQFIAHNCLAEMKYLLRTGVPLPRRWFDTMVAWRHLTNRPNFPPCGLSEVLHRLGLPHLAPVEKQELRDRILHLRFDAHCPEARRTIVGYCYSDCDGGAVLHRHLHFRVRPEWMAHWCEYLKAVSRMELRGIRLDLACWDRIQAGAPQIRQALRDDINKTWPVYQGETFKRKEFWEWCRHAGIRWPSRISPATGKSYFSLGDDALKDMEPRHPFIGAFRQVNKTLRQLGRRKMVIDRGTGLHHFDTMPFRSITGRNAPKGFIFAGPKWQRWLMVPESPDHVFVYVDYVGQEIGNAAALSGDPEMRAAYEADDCHMAFAIRANAAPAGATKRTHPEVRKRYKAVNLGVIYGQTEQGISARLGISYREAAMLLAEHKKLFPVYWKWSERMVQSAFDTRRIGTPCGWQCKVPFASNERSWMNWPMQSVGSDIMRATITYLDRQNVRLLAPVHDGFLLTCRRGQETDLRAAVDYACERAVGHSLPGFPMRWEVTPYGTRFEDADGAELWHRLRNILGDCRDGAATG
jgi:hypothetical protein